MDFPTLQFPFCAILVLPGTRTAVPTQDLVTANPTSSNISSFPSWEGKYSEKRKLFIRKQACRVKYRCEAQRWAEQIGFLYLRGSMSTTSDANVTIVTVLLFKSPLNRHIKHIQPVKMKVKLHSLLLQGPLFFFSFFFLPHFYILLQFSPWITQDPLLAKWHRGTWETSCTNGGSTN